MILIKDITEENFLHESVGQKIQKDPSNIRTEWPVVTLPDKATRISK